MNCCLKDVGGTLVVIVNANLMQRDFVPTDSLGFLLICFLKWYLDTMYLEFETGKC